MGLEIVDGVPWWQSRLRTSHSHCCGLGHSCGEFNPWPGKFHMPKSWPRKGNKLFFTAWSQDIWVKWQLENPTQHSPYANRKRGGEVNGIWYTPWEQGCRSFLGPKDFFYIKTLKFLFKCFYTTRQQVKSFWQNYSYFGDNAVVVQPRKFYYHDFIFIYFCLDQTCSMQKFWGQGWNLHHSWNPSHSSDNARSLTHCATGELHDLIFKSTLWVS